MAKVKRRNRKVGTDAGGNPIYRLEGYRVRYVDPMGTERSKAFRLGEKDKADAFAVEVESRKNTGDWLDLKARKLSVDELATKLLGSKRGRNLDWANTMLVRVLHRFGGRPIASLDHYEIQEWIDGLVDDGLGPDSVRGSFRLLHEVVSLGLRGRSIAHDPCHGVKLPPVDRREMLFLTPTQINVLAEAIERTFPGHGYAVLVRFTAYSGVRAGEAGAVRVRDLRPLERTVFIEKARRRDGRNGTLKGGSKGRWVGLPRQLVDELAAHIARHGLGPNDYLWSGEKRSAQLDHHWFYRSRWCPVVDDLTDRGLLPASARDGKRCRLRFHDLRHTCVALLIAKRARQYEVMRHLGHTNIQTTINTYGHLFPEVDEDIKVHLETTWSEGEAAYLGLNDQVRTERLPRGA